MTPVLRLLGLLAALALTTGPVWAQPGIPQGGAPNQSLPVRCVDVTGTVFEACGGAGASGLTDAELRASPVPVSGTVTADTELPAAAALTDNFANPTAPAVGAFSLIWDGATWDRWTGTVNLGTVGGLLLDASLTGRFPAGATPADNESNASTQSRIGAYLFCFDGTTWDRCPGNSTDGLLVNLGANNDVTITSGTITTVSTVTTVTNPVQVVGDVAHDAAAGAVDPVLTGCYASAAAPTNVSADADATREWCLRNGARAVQPTYAGVLASVNAGAADTGTPRVAVATQSFKRAYAASAAVTQTNLDGLASSATHVAGWEGAAIDNSANLYSDYTVNAKIQVESAGLAAGEIRLYLVAELDDSTWPDVFDGTESTETITSTEIRDAIARLCAITATTTTASRVYYLNCPSVATVFGGLQPRTFVPFITQSTGTTLETTGDPNQVYVRGAYMTGN